MMNHASAHRWVNELSTAWRAGDPDRVAGLFAVDTEYRSHPFRPPQRGRAAIADYWRKAMVRGRNLDTHFGSPIVDGDRVAVEWWASITEDGAETVSTGALFLTFADGRCTALREVWTEQAGRAVPYAGWGS